jgi:hypothetical protein
MSRTMSIEQRFEKDRNILPSFEKGLQFLPAGFAATALMQSLSFDNANLWGACGLPSMKRGLCSSRRRANCLAIAL